MRVGLRERFNRHTFINLTTGCHEWTGSLDRDGYGRVRVGPRMMSAHRAAVLMDGRDIPQGMVAAHTCGNRRCCNPRHLDIITQGANIWWSHKAGRYLHRKTRPHRIPDLTVAEMRSCHERGWSVRRLADYFQVSLGHTADIVAGRVRRPKYEVEGTGAGEERVAA